MANLNGRLTKDDLDAIEAVADRLRRKLVFLPAERHTRTVVFGRIYVAIIKEVLAMARSGVF